VTSVRKGEHAAGGGTATMAYATGNADTTRVISNKMRLKLSVDLDLKSWLCKNGRKKKKKKKKDNHSDPTSEYGRRNRDRDAYFVKNMMRAAANPNRGINGQKNVPILI
jgi:hypothetical protein